MNPGVYTDLSNDDYQSQTDWVSSSMLKRLLPEHFKPFAGSASADFGSIFHQRFTAETVPIETVDAATWQGKAAKEQLAAIQGRGHYAILTGDLPLIDRMEEAVRDHKEATALLTGFGTWETSVFAEVDGVPSRCRFDRISGSDHAVDIKTTKEQPGGKNLSKAVVNYGYDLSAAHYLETARAAGIEFADFSLVFVQNCEPFHVTVATLDDAFMERGAAMRDLALQRWLHPTMVDAYPGQRGTIELTCPGWAKL